MDTKINIPIEKQDIKEVRTVRSDDEANKLLAEGWVLLHSGASHIDGLGYNAKTHFIMGRIK